MVVLKRTKNKTCKCNCTQKHLAGFLFEVEVPVVCRCPEVQMKLYKTKTKNSVKQKYRNCYT